MGIRTIEFEDYGQDFLEWDVNDDGLVTGCRPPFQGAHWCGSKVVNHKNIQPGEKVEIIHPLDDDILEIKYPIICINEVV